MADIYASCAACAFWFQVGAMKHECRRYPPRVKFSDWPETDANDWCGEFRRRDSDAVKPLIMT